MANTTLTNNQLKIIDGGANYVEASISGSDRANITVHGTEGNIYISTRDTIWPQTAYVEVDDGPMLTSNSVAFPTTGSYYWRVYGDSSYNLIFDLYDI